MSLESIRRRNAEFVAAAMAISTRLDDQYISTPVLMEALKEVVPRDDSEKAHERKCKKILDDASHPGNFESFGQLRFPFDADVYAYEPNRPVKTDDDRVVELKYALPDTTLAEARRARKKYEEDGVWVGRKQTVADEHGAWALREVTKGRPLTECTFETFIKEQGILFGGAAE